METDQLAEFFEICSHSSPETEERIRIIREGIKTLPEVPAYKETLMGGLDDGDVFRGSSIYGASFEAVMMVIAGGSERTKLLRLNMYGDERGRSRIAVDFMLALGRFLDARAEAHDDIDADDQLYWRM